MLAVPNKAAFFCAKITLRNVETRHNFNAYHYYQVDESKTDDS